MNNALEQYIKLFDDNRQLIDDGSCEPMNLERDSARKLVGFRLPEKGDEGYEKTSINDMFAPDYGVNLGRLSLPCNIAETFRCSVPNVSPLVVVVQGDSIAATTPKLADYAADGLTVCSLREAADRFPSELRKYYNKIAQNSSASQAALSTTHLNTMLAQDGIFIRIANGCHFSNRPIQIVNVTPTDTPTLLFRRVLIVAEKDSSSSILFCEHSQGAPDVTCAVSQVVEVVVEDNARVEICEIEETCGNIRRLNQVYVSQQTANSVKMTTATLQNTLTRNEFYVDLLGAHADCQLYGMAIGSDRQHIDNLTRITHHSPDCDSNQLFRFVLDGQAVGAFEGGIEVKPTAPGTRAFQRNNNILADDNARMFANPLLIINNDDVKCSHGATTGQLDRQALFYMQTRGIPFEEARTMLMQAFMVDVVDSVGLQPLRDRLRYLVERRFSGKGHNCATCSAR